ncbi:MAG: DUF2283 domain-containing protein [Methanosarcinales archaeon]|nr:DUF2283 domain-containing protein [Methanosarcinales archaeon]
MKGGDVLYINFKKPSHTDDSEHAEDDAIVRYEKGEIMRITVLNASRRRAEYGCGVCWGVIWIRASLVASPRGVLYALSQTSTDFKGVPSC